MKICEKQDCTGCGACKNICPQSCIDIVFDNEGFLRYKIDENKCVNCGKCLNVCPTLIYCDPKQNIEPFVYSGWNKDEHIRQASSSGGLFSVLAENIISKGGVVFGAVYDKKNDVKHVSYKGISDLKYFRGSKYIQSDIGVTFLEAEEYLKNGTPVLFSGTPCQIAGLYSFLGKDYPNLITCDLVCHGVLSYKVYRDVISYIENKHNSKVDQINFRDKITGWKNSSVSVLFKNKKLIKEIRNISLLAFGFASGFANNITCSNCKHSLFPRRADITLGDYGGKDYIKFGKENIRQGISLIIVNSKKGKELFDAIKEELFFQGLKLDIVVKDQPNISSSNILHPKRDIFFKEYEEKGFEYVRKKYLKAPIKIKLIYFIGREKYYFFRNILKKIWFAFRGKKNA